MSREFPNFKIVGKEGHGKFSGQRSDVSVLDHDGHKEFIVPDNGVGNHDAARRWFYLTYLAGNAIYSRDGEKYKLLTNDGDYFWVERLDPGRDYIEIREGDSVDYEANPSGDQHGELVTHSFDSFPA